MQDDRQILVHEAAGPRVQDFNLHVAIGGPEREKTRRQHVAEPAVHPHQGALIILEIDHARTLAERPGLHNDIQLLMDQPRRPLRHDFYAHVAQRIDEPVPAGFEQSAELAVAKQQTEFEFMNLDALEQHDVPPPRSAAVIVATGFQSVGPASWKLAATLSVNKKTPLGGGTSRLSRGQPGGRLRLSSGGGPEALPPGSQGLVRWACPQGSRESCQSMLAGPPRRYPHTAWPRFMLPWPCHRAKVDAGQAGASSCRAWLATADKRVPAPLRRVRSGSRGPRGDEFARRRVVQDSNLLRPD